LRLKKDLLGCVREDGSLDPSVLIARVLKLSLEKRPLSDIAEGLTAQQMLRLMDMHSRVVEKADSKHNGSDEKKVKAAQSFVDMLASLKKNDAL
jgi:hypothetical protein